MRTNHTHTHTHIHTRTHGRTHARTHTHTHTHACTHACTHAHTHTWRLSAGRTPTIGQSVYLPKIGRVRSIVVWKLTVFLVPAGWKYHNFYRVLRYKIDLLWSLRKVFLIRETYCPTDRARSLFFGFLLFVLLIFYFWLVFFLLVPDCTTTRRKFFPAVKYPLFRCSVYLFWVAMTVFFLFFPSTHSGKVEQASMVLRRRPSHHKDADTREALPATLAWPKFSWSSSAIWTIFTSSWKISVDQPTLSGPKARAIGWQLVLDFLSCWERDEEVEKGDRDRKKKPKWHRSVARGQCLLRWRR